MNPFEAALSHLPSVNLLELNQNASLQTRIDRKYLVPGDAFATVIATFAHPAPGAELPLVLEEGGRRTFAYDSVYFDTPGLESYLSAAHGRRRRFKIRTRTYLDSATSFLEVKTEGVRSSTVKERIPYELANRSTITADGAAYVRETLSDITEAEALNNLLPVIETRYGRITLLLPESSSRATIDIGVSWKSPWGQSLKLTDYLVVETKSGSQAGPLDKLLWRAGIRPSRISKFATGMAALNPHLPANRWHQSLSKYLQQPISQLRSVS